MQKDDQANKCNSVIDISNRNKDNQDNLFFYYNFFYS